METHIHVSVCMCAWYVLQPFNYIILLHCLKIQTYHFILGLEMRKLELICILIIKKFFFVSVYSNDEKGIVVFQFRSPMYGMGQVSIIFN